MPRASIARSWSCPKTPDLDQEFNEFGDLFSKARVRSLSGGCEFWLRTSRRAGHLKRKEDGKAGAGSTRTNGAPDPDRASQPAYDPVGNPQAETGALLSLGCKE